MTEGASVVGSHHRSVASIPSRRSLNVQLGPAASTGDDDQQQPDGRHSAGGWTTVEQPLSSTQRTSRRHPSHRQQQQQQQQPPHPQYQQHQRVRWSRMASSAAAVPEPQLTAAASAAASAASASAAAGLCQLVDIGETRELIRRHRETAKKLADVHSIVGHLSLEKENSQGSRGFSTSWATFRQQPNSQFKQYVFQSPGRQPLLPAAEAPTASGQRPQLQRSRTTLGLVTGRPAARHSRPEPLGGGAALRRELTTAAAAVGDLLHRESSHLSGLSRPPAEAAARYRGHGHSSNIFPAESDGLYGQFERRRAKNVRLD